MGYSKEEWDECYKKIRQINKWPYSEVISIINRYTTIKKDDKMLELGFGTGLNIMFFNSIGVRYYGIEGSETAVQYARKKFPDIQNNLQIADFTQNLVFKEKFNYIIDRGSLTHNSTKGIKKTVDLIYDQLAEGKPLSWAPLSPLGSWVNPVNMNLKDRTVSFQSQVPWILMTPLFYGLLIYYLNQRGNAR